MASSRAKAEETRRVLLEAAAQEISRHGFRAAGMDQILTRAGMTKGALYHHFGSKKGLGYAVVDEIFGPQLLARWTGPLEAEPDPVVSIRNVLDTTVKQMQGDALQCGCPVNSLAQEMAPLDEGFRRRLAGVFGAWRGAIAIALERGKARGLVRENVDSEMAAIFIVSVVEGGVGAGKVAQDPSLLQATMGGLGHYLEALRPRISFRGSQIP